MINRFGVRAHDYPKGQPRELLTAIAADGWQSIQLAPGKALEGLESAEHISGKLLAQTINAMRENELELGVYGAYLELGFVDEQSRRGQTKRFTAQLEIAKALGAHCIGSETTSFAKQPQASQKDALRALYSSLEEILPQAQQLGMTVAVEPVWYHSLSSPELARCLLDDMRSKQLAIIIDPVNLLKASDVETQRGLWDKTVELLGEDVVAIHCKGGRRDAGEQLKSCLLEQSEAELGYVLRLLNKLPQPLTAFREEAVPARAEQDIEFLRSLL